MNLEGHHVIDLDEFAVQGKPFNAAWRKIVETAEGLASATEFYGKGSRAERLWINRLVKAVAELQTLREAQIQKSDTEPI